MHIIMMYFAMLLSSGFWVPPNDPDCIWSFDLGSHQVYKGSSYSRIFNCEFPREYFLCGNSIYFFDSCGVFRNAMIVEKNQRVRDSDGGRILFVRDDAPITSGAARCSVEVLDGKGDILCRSYFNIMIFDQLVGIEEGIGYFKRPANFSRGAFYDSSLAYIPDDHEYWVLDYFVNETRKQVLFLASTVGGPLSALTECSLLCKDYKGTRLWDVPLGKILTRSFHIRASAEIVVVCFEDDANNARLIIYTPQGDIVRSVSLPFKPIALSNILDNHFIILQHADNHLVAHVHSARAIRPKAFTIGYGGDIDDRSSWSVKLYGGNRLLISSRDDDSWHYAYYQRISKRLHSAILTQESEPMVFINDNDMLIVKMESNRISIVAY